ncbi:MAG: hypothetical protein C4527_02435, partial [Candidatus Omnitrophota bacterium]
YGYSWPGESCKGGNYTFCYFLSFFSLPEADLLQLFEENGWNRNEKGRLVDQEGNKFHFVILSEKNNSLVEIPALLLRNQLNEIGIDMEIEWKPFEEIFKRMNNGEYEAIFMYMSAESSPDRIYSFWHSPTSDTSLNYWNYKNERIDRLIEELRANFDMQDRYPIYSQILREFAADPPGVFLFYQYLYLLHSKQFNIKIPNPYAMYETIHQWEISEN